MKQLILFLILLVFAFTNAQTANSTAMPNKPGLTAEQVTRAKDLYDKMMQSETYKLRNEGSKLVGKKLKGVNVFPDMKEAVKWPADSLKNYIYAQIEKNLPQTGFASAAEARELMEANTALMRKQMDENAELYEYIKLANLEQIKEIHAKMFEAKREELFGPKED